MAIREVLTSFTFEQQRQMINLIGVDIGDVATLTTPTLEVVSGINEIINGDVDLNNQTINMDPGTLSSPSLFWDAGQGFYQVDATKLGLSTSLAIAGDLEVDGDITFRAGSGSGGTLTFGDLDTDNIIFNADVQSSIVPDSTANYNLGTATKQWNNLWIDGTAAIDTLTVDENATIVGSLTIDSGNIYVPLTQTTVNLFDGTATDVNAFADGTAIRIGATTGTLTLRNPTIVGTETTQNLFNTVATTVNAFGAAEEVFMGVSLGGAPGSNSNFTINSDDTILVGDLNVNGGEILSSSNTFDLLINNSDVRIGSAPGTGTTTINNSLSVKGNFDIATSAVDLTIVDNSATALDIKEGTNSYLTFATTDSAERIIAHKDFYVTGNLYVDGTETIINTTTLSVDDKQIVLGDIASPTDALADNGGILLQATSPKTITYNSTDNIWDLNIGAKINGNTTIRSSAGTIALDLTSTNYSEIIFEDRTSDTAYRWEHEGLAGRFDLTYNNAESNAQSQPVRRLSVTSDGLFGFGKDSPTDEKVTIKQQTGNEAQLKLEQSNAADGWKFHADGPGGGDLLIKREISGVDTTVLTLPSGGGGIFGDLPSASTTSLGTEISGDGVIDTRVGTSSAAITVRESGSGSTNITLSGDGSATFAGSITSNGITQYTLPTIANGGQLGYDDGTKSLRLYSNSSTNVDAKIQFHFNQSSSSDIEFFQGGIASFNGNVDVGTNSATSDSDHTIDGGLYGMYSITASFTTTRSINISNLTDGSKVIIHVRNTNGSQRTINILASTTTSGFAAVNMMGSNTGAPSVTAANIGATSGTLFITVANINGTFCGHFG